MPTAKTDALGFYYDELPGGWAMTAMCDPSWIKRRRTNPKTYPGSGSPLFLIQHGSDDDLVQVAQAMLLPRAPRGVMPEADVRFDVISESLHSGPVFETEENMAHVFAFLSAVLAPLGKATLDKAG